MKNKSLFCTTVTMLLACGNSILVATAKDNPKNAQQTHNLTIETEYILRLTGNYDNQETVVNFYGETINN